MAEPHPGTPRRIVFDGVTPSTSAPAPGLTPAHAAVPPPPWQRDEQTEIPIIRPNAHAAISVDIAALQARIDTNFAQIQADTSALLAKFSALTGAFQPAYDAANASRSAALEHALLEIETRHADLTAHAQRMFDEGSATAHDDIAASVAALAPGVAGSPWTVDAVRDAAQVRAPADFARVGTVAIGDSSFPAIAPLGPGAGWYLTGDRHRSHDLLFSAVARVVAQSPVTNLAIDVFDPRMSARLAALAPLRPMNDSIFPPPHSHTDTFARRVEQILAAAPANAEKVVSSGASSLTEFWRSQPAHEGTLNVVVVLDYPYGIDRSAQTALCRLAALGPAAGAIVLVQHDASALPAAEVVPSELASALLSVASSSDSVVVDLYPATVTIRPEIAPAADVIAEVMSVVRTRAASDQGPIIPLEDLISRDLAEPWSRSSLEAIEMTVGRIGREVLELQLRTENPPHPNMLIGGSVGTGKSNLLLDLIFSSAIAHSPDELELVLLDFKRGLEFKRFDADENGEGWLPHVSVLSLESNQEFGVSVLDYVNDEMERRAELFKDGGGYQSINAYRRGTGAILPRMLLVIDEFHILFEGDERLTEIAVARLDTIAKQGRAYGIHLMLASQTISGISGLRSKGQSIFAQFPIRVSLKNTPDESQAILAARNTAAADLVHRGEVVVNRNFGNPVSNERAVAAFVDSDKFLGVQRELWNRGHGSRPLVFLGRQFAEWDIAALARVQPGASLDLWVGSPIRVTTQPSVVSLQSDAAQAVAIVGPDNEREPVVPAVVSGMIVSAAQQLGAEDSIVVLNGMGEVAPGWLVPAIEHAAELGISVTMVPASECAAYLRNNLGTRTRDSASTVLAIVLGVQRIPGLDDSVVVVPPADDADDTGGLIDLKLMHIMTEPVTGSARAALKQLALDGALRGTHLVGWWSSVAALSNDLAGSHAGVGTYLTASLGSEDLKYITNTFAPHVDGHPRIGVLNRNSSVGLHSAVPFHPWDHDHERRFRGVL